MDSAATKMRLERRSGVSLWRQVADGIRQHYLPSLAAGAKLPPETELAKSFGVNRHTVRAAIAALESEGILRAEQGRGTFLANRRRLRYPIAKRTRFSAGLGDQTLRRESRLIASARTIATPEVAEALELAPGAPVLSLDTVASADGTPLTRGRSWCDAERFPELDEIYARTNSYTKALMHYDILDYTRKSTIITAVHADPDDLEWLKLSPGAIVMTVRAINIDPSGTPVQYSENRFSADRMEFVIDAQAG